MSSPVLLMNRKVFDAVTIDQNRSSEVVDISEAVGMSAHFIWTGTPVGSVLVFDVTCGR